MYRSGTPRGTSIQLDKKIEILFLQSIEKFLGNTEKLRKVENSNFKYIKLIN